MTARSVRKGTAMVLSLCFLVIFTALAASMATLSGASVQTAKNQSEANAALAAAESGLEVTRYWLSRFVMPKTTPPSHYLSTIVASLGSDLKDCGVSNLVLENDGSIPAVALNSATGTSFSAEIEVDPVNPNVVQVTVTGISQTTSRTIRVSYCISPYEHPILNYGLATKGAIRFPNNPTVTGVNSSWEADIYTESGSDLIAIQVGGNLKFDGDISIGNPLASVDFQGDVVIAGDQGQAAIDNHVGVGVGLVDFPALETQPFQKYATGPVIDDTVDLSKGMTLTNARIPAGTNPTFTGSIIINGILLIEAPNVVTFSRNVALNGVIVGGGDSERLDDGDSRIDFLGNFATGPYPEGPEFEGISSVIGTSILAPDFDASFQGNFSTMDGVMAVDGVHISGNCNAQVKGTIISYSDEPALIEGNVVMNFDRVASTKVPAGFDTHRVLAYDPSSYTAVY